MFSLFTYYYYNFAPIWNLFS